VIAWWWSWLLTVLGAFGLLVAGRRPWGWLWGVGVQFAWVAYALASRQFGFLASAALYASVYVLNYRHQRTKKGGRPIATEDGAS